MSKGNTTENDYVKFVLNGTAMPAYGAILYAAAHTADPGEAGAQNTSECAYGAYARVAVTRDGSGFVVAGNQGSNAAQVTFPECTSGSESITHVSLGTASTGAGQILYSGALTAPINVSLNITPLFPASALVVTED